jgi:hypothetical protein
MEKALGLVPLMCLHEDAWKRGLMVSDNCIKGGEVVEPGNKPWISMQYLRAEPIISSSAFPWCSCRSYITSFFDALRAS